MNLPYHSFHQDSGIPWVGEVPADWSITPLLGVAQERCNPNIGMQENNLLSLSYGKIVRKNIYATDGLLPESFETYQIIEPNDIVLRLTDLQNDKRSLRSALVAERGIITCAYLAIACTGISSQFMSYLLRAYDSTKVFYSMGGGLRQSMKFSDVKRMPILVPSTEEQLAIASFLDREITKIDILISAQEKLFKFLAEKRQATISHAVTRGLDPDVPMKDTGVEWMGMVPVHWNVVPVAYRYEVQLGKMLDAAKIKGDNLRPYLRVFDVQWGKINIDSLPTMDFDENARKKFRLESGDILVNEGGNPGRSAIWSGELNECYYQKALHRLRPISIEADVPLFFYYVLYWAANYGVFSFGGNETTIEHLPAEKLRRYRFAFPPVAEQRKISEYLELEISKLETLQRTSEHAIELLKERRAALIFAAVTGKIDVREHRSALAAAA